MIDISRPFVGWCDMGVLREASARYQVRLVVQKSFGPLAQVLGGHESAVLADCACAALSMVGVQNAGQLDSSGLNPMKIAQ